jgi:NAD(P)-dependent dehydrogenase (short-subunit alcohol dehydrogenase family)
VIIGQVALVTGVSSGIGEAAARALAAKGFKVYGTSRKATAQPVDGVNMVRLDVTDDASVEAAVKEAVQKAGRIDVLVNNAGAGIAGGAVESSIPQAQALFDANFFGAIRLIRAIVPHMRKQRAGRIVNVSSVLGFLPAPYMAIYAATKHAMEGYSESLDHELRTAGIRVTLVEPAYTRTSFDQNMAGPDAELAEYETIRAPMAVLLTKVMETADEPEVVAEAIVRAATDFTPELRYPAGPLARRLAILRRFAPAGLVDGSLRKQMGLDG